MLAAHEQLHDVRLDLDEPIPRDRISLFAESHAALNLLREIVWLKGVDDLQDGVSIVNHGGRRDGTRVEIRVCLH